MSVTACAKFGYIVRDQNLKDFDLDNGALEHHLNHKINASTEPARCSSWEPQMMSELTQPGSWIPVVKFNKDLNLSVHVCSTFNFAKFHFAAPTFHSWFAKLLL
jgi:hypothetical protein